MSSHSLIIIRFVFKSNVHATAVVRLLLGIVVELHDGRDRAMGQLQVEEIYIFREIMARNYFILEKKSEIIRF